MVKPVIHFVGFRGDEYTTAVKIWGVPDFIHPANDPRLRIDICDGDIVIYANMSDLNPKEKNVQDLIPQDPENGV